MYVSIAITYSTRSTISQAISTPFSFDLSSYQIILLKVLKYVQEITQSLIGSDDASVFNVV